MIHVVSIGSFKAQVIVQEPSGVRRTVHLLNQGGRWTDRFGTPYNLQGGEVNWVLYYENQLDKAIREKELDKWPALVQDLVHALHLAGLIERETFDEV